MTLNLFTPVKVPDIKERLGANSGVAVLGSCFSERIGKFLQDGGMRVWSNPCGIVYNAVSMADTMRRVTEGRDYAAADFFEQDGLWFSWEHHGVFARRNADAAAAVCNQAMSEFRKGLETAQLLVLTFSSSVVYELRETGTVVANCHKMPGSLFLRRVLSYDENREAIADLIRAVRKIRPDLRLVLTLSPVRHYPGDLVLNAHSKANLLAALHATPDENSVYFPAYEIMTDELRDYRFYRDDMLHPSELAANIICRRFAESWFTPEALAQIEANHRRAREAAHRPIHGDDHA